MVEEEGGASARGMETGAEGVAPRDAIHYGMEKPPHLAMFEWFRARVLPAEFVPDGPK